MNHLEELSYDYQGFREGEYMHRYFLPESLRPKINPRDILVVYWILRGFTIATHPRQMMPSAFREVSTLPQNETIANALLEDALTITYVQEQLTREIPVEQLIEIVRVCSSYMRAIADTELNEAETEFLIGLNDRLKVLQHEVAQRIDIMKSFTRGKNENNELKVRYIFELSSSDPDYAELDDNTIYYFTDDIYAMSAVSSDSVFEEMIQRDAKDWNDKYHIENRLYQTPHSWLFHVLDIFSAVPLRHFLKIGHVTASFEVLSNISIQPIREVA